MPKGATPTPGFVHPFDSLLPKTTTYAALQDKGMVIDGSKMNLNETAVHVALQKHKEGAHAG